jgi:hypothetical protein
MAPRPGLEPGTYGLTGHGPNSAASRASARFLLGQRPISAAPARRARARRDQAETLDIGHADHRVTARRSPGEPERLYSSSMTAALSQFRPHADDGRRCIHCTWVRVTAPGPGHARLRARALGAYVARPVRIGPAAVGNASRAPMTIWAIAGSAFARRPQGTHTDDWTSRGQPIPIRRPRPSGSIEDPPQQSGANGGGGVYTSWMSPTIRGG